MEKKGMKRLRFTYTDDLMLLREVVAENPFRDTSSWESVQRNLEIASGKVFSIKTLKNHLELLLYIFLKKDSVTKIRSGTEDPYSEKDHLLQEVALLSSEYKEISIKKKKIVSKEKQISILGKQARDKYASVFIEQPEFHSEDFCDNEIVPQEVIIECLEDHSYVQQNTSEKPEQQAELQVAEASEATHVQAELSVTNNTAAGNSRSTPATLTPQRKVLVPSRTRQKRGPTIRKNALAYLTEKHEKDCALRQQEIEIQNKKIELENRKCLLEEEKLKLEYNRFEVESRERAEKMKMDKDKWNMEIDQKKVTTQLLLSQQKIINNFVKEIDVSNVQEYFQN